MLRKKVRELNTTHAELHRENKQLIDENNEIKEDNAALTDENASLREEVEGLILELRELGEQRYRDLGGGYTEEDDKGIDEDNGQALIGQNSQESEQ